MSKYQIHAQRCVDLAQRLLRVANHRGDLSPMQVFDAVNETLVEAPQSTCGFFVNNRNELKPIPGALIDGKIAVPIPDKSEPIHRKLRAVTIDSLCEADGQIALAESFEVSPDDPQELLPPAPIPVAGEETTEESDEEFEPVEEDEQVSEVADEESEDRGDCAA
jgi:hypothetical protein